MYRGATTFRPATRHASIRLLTCRANLLRRSHLSSNAQQQLVQTAADALTQQQQANLSHLADVFTPLEVDKLVKGNPAVLGLPTADWLRFFEGYGLGKEAMWKALRYSAHHLVDPYTAGAAIFWLKQLGPWSDADVRDRLISCYPKVLATSTDTLQALMDTLLGLDLDRSAVQKLLWEFPGLMADFREDTLPLIVRMVESRRDKYTNGGLYID